MDGFIPVNEPLLDGNERKYLNECIDSGWISSQGPFVERFEQSFSHTVGRQHGIAVCNGTQALELAVRTLDLAPGDEVILPSFTIISCATAILRAGATPVLVDCDGQTWNMDVTQVRAKITPKTRAIMVVHIYGLPVDMDPLLRLCHEHRLKLIEDSAESIGLSYKGRPCGSFGEISIFSFYANKLVTTGEGGMLATDDQELARKCRYLRNLAFGDPRFVHDQLAWNMRFTNVQAAIGLAQVERLKEFIQRKRKMGRRYDRLLQNLPGLQKPLVKTDDAENLFWIYGLVLDDDVPFDAAEMIRRLGQLKIGSQPFFWPMHEQPVFKKMGLFKGESYPLSERIARRGFYVPSGLAITDSQIERVAEALHRIMANA